MHIRKRSHKTTSTVITEWVWKMWGLLCMHVCVCVDGWVLVVVGDCGERICQKHQNNFFKLQISFQTAAWFRECWFDVSLSKNLWNKDAVHIRKKIPACVSSFFCFAQGGGISCWQKLLWTCWSSLPDEEGTKLVASVEDSLPYIMQTPLVVTLRLMESSTLTPPRVFSTNIVWKERYP